MTTSRSRIAAIPRGGKSAAETSAGSAGTLVLVFALILGALVINVLVVPERFMVGSLYLVPIVIASRRLSARSVAVVSAFGIGTYLFDAFLEKPPAPMVPLALAAFVVISYFAVASARHAEELRAAARESERFQHEADEALRRAEASETCHARLRAEAQEAVRARDEFLSVAGHELRTPIHIVSLLAQAALWTARSDERRADLVPRLEELEAAVERLRRLTGQLLDVSRIAAGKLALERDDFDLRDLVSDVQRRFASGFARAGCDLHLELASIRGRWDRERLDQVLTNLFANALKYGAGRPIRIRLTAQEGAAVLSVRDQGIGIPSDEQERVFERFERGSSARGRPGMGLGLWIARSIVEAHGGAIEVASELGRGSEFRIRLPLGT